MIQVLETIPATKSFCRRITGHGRSLGFVPTMGALHQGHLELVKKAKSECDSVIVSIFVNPTQFNDPKDLQKYPRTLDADLQLLSTVGADAVFYPDAKSMYPDDYHFKISESVLSQDLCGAHRPGHFDGVLTVVMKLFQIVGPSKAYFGEKDFQQLTLIQQMSQAFFLDLQVIPVPTVREPDHLAMSSRNMRLNPEERAKAPLIFKALTESQSDQEAISTLEAAGFRVDYVRTINNRRYAAAFLGDVRLIDNVEL